MRCPTGTNLRRCTSYLVCFSLLLQTTGIAAALPLPPGKTFQTESELAAGPAATRPAPAPSDPGSAVPDLLEETWASPASKISTAIG